MISIEFKMLIFFSAIDGIPAITGLIGKRSEEFTAEDVESVRGLADILSGLISQAIKPAVTTALQTTAGLLAQITAGIGNFY